MEVDEVIDPGKVEVIEAAVRTLEDETEEMDIFRENAFSDDEKYGGDGGENEDDNNGDGRDENGRRREDDGDNNDDDGDGGGEDDTGSKNDVEEVVCITEMEIMKIFRKIYKLTFYINFNHSLKVRI